MDKNKYEKTVEEEMKRNYKKIIIDEVGNVSLPIEEISQIINLSFDDFMRSLNKTDSIYYDKMTGRYMARIDGVRYHLDFSDKLVENLEKGLDTEYVKMLRERMHREKVEDIKQMVKDDEEFPVDYDDIDLYEDILYKMSGRTKALARKEFNSIMNNIIIVGSGAVASLGAAAYVTDKSWSAFVMLISLSAILGGTINVFERIPRYDRLLARKKRLKRQTKEFNAYVKELFKEDIKVLKLYSLYNYLR